jgi:PAS domain S-box-containing protein
MGQPIGKTGLLLDVEQIDRLLEKFHKLTGMVAGLLDLEGNILAKSGWRSICMSYFRQNPEAAARCNVSDTILAHKIAEDKSYHFYTCLNGLVDVAYPVRVNGEHVANLFSGQFLFEPPDLDFFREKAHQMRIDEEEFIQEVLKVPVVSKEDVLTAMDFLLEMTHLISHLTHQKQALEEMNSKLIASKKVERETKHFKTIAERQYKTLFTEMLDGFALHEIICDHEANPVNYRFIDVNPAFERITGLHAKSIIGQTVLDVLPGTESYWIEEYGKVALTGKPTTFQNYSVEIDKYFEVTAFQPAPYQFACIFQDITERIRLQTQLEGMNAALEQKVKLRTAQLEASNNELASFSYSVSHDLRAPLRQIQGYVDLLNKNCKNTLTESANRYLGVIASATTHMKIMIDELLQFSHIGQQHLKKTKLNMQLIVMDVVQSARLSLHNRVIKWELSTLPVVEGDYMLLKRVWTNLIENAVKFTRDCQEARISISCMENEKEVVFCISDNGVGFDMKYADKLFSVFQRLHAQTEFEGTGIGLANVQRIVAKHNGRVWAESKPGNGARFYFSIPRVN